MKSKTLFSVSSRRIRLWLWGCFGLLFILALVEFSQYDYSSGAIIEAISKSQTMSSALLFSQPVNFLHYLSISFFSALFAPAMAIFAGVTAMILIPRAIREGMMSYYLTPRLSRGAVMLIQVQCHVTHIALLCTMTALMVSIMNLLLAQPPDLLIVAHLTFASFSLAIFVGGYSFLLSSVSSDERIMCPILLLITALLFSIMIASRIDPDLAWLRFLTPFSAYTPQNIALKSDAWLKYGLLTSAGAGLYALSCWLFTKKDLPL